MQRVLLGISVFVAMVLPQLSFAFPARFGLSPDNSQDLLFSVLNSAQQELTINIYEFKSIPILNTVIARIQAGVNVHILIEGQPAGFMAPSSKSVINQLQTAMVAQANPNNTFYVMSSQSGGTRRFAFDHAKYIVVDKKRVMISSENFSPTTYAEPGLNGNRGWHAVLESPVFAAQMLSLFASDADPSQADLLDMLTQTATFAVKKQPEMKQHPRTVETLAGGKGDVSSVSLVTSPDSLGGIQSLIDSAQKYVDVEFASLPPEWATPTKHQNPILDSLIAAATRNVHVRVLLNDDSVFNVAQTNTGGTPAVPKPRPIYSNEVTVKLLQDLATTKGLPIEAQIVNVKAVDITYIHNKGILVDGDRKSTRLNSSHYGLSRMPSSA